MGASSESQAARPEKRLDGVDGWLLVLVMWLLLVNPVLSPILNWADIRANEQQYPVLVTDPYWQSYTTASWAQQAIAIVAFLICGLLLLKYRRPFAIRAVIALLWIAGPLLVIATMVVVANAHGVRLAATEMWDALRPSVATAGWTVYLLTSRRVRNTYRLGQWREQ